jgi:Mor family transcriptional regulator
MSSRPWREKWDAVERGPYPTSYLTPIEVLEIYSQRELGPNIPQLAKRYGVARSTVQRILEGRTWTSLTGRQQQRQLQRQLDNPTSV